MVPFQHLEIFRKSPGSELMPATHYPYLLMSQISNVNLPFVDSFSPIQSGKWSKNANNKTTNITQQASCQNTFNSFEMSQIKCLSCSYRYIKNF